MVEDEDKAGLGEEPQRGFATDHSLDAYTSLHRLVLLSYRYRCALTGAQFAPPKLHLHLDLDVAVIKPLEQGGPLSIGNCLPLLSSLRSPFMDGLIAIEDNYRILVPHPELLDRDMLTSLRVSLVVPEDEVLRPAIEFLAHHRRYALGR